jgi:hypothetical protein
MKTFELTFQISTEDDSDIDLSRLEKEISHYENSDLEFVEMEMIEPSVVMVTFEMKAESIHDCPDELEALNDEAVVDEPELYVTERVSHVSY